MDLADPCGKPSWSSQSFMYHHILCALFLGIHGVQEIQVSVIVGTTWPPWKWQRGYSNTYPTRCKITQFILSGNCSTCFGWYHHPSSGAHTNASTASGICQTVTAICRYCGRDGTGLSVLWVA